MTTYTQEEFEQYLLAERQAHLAAVDAIEVLLHLPRTSELRRSLRKLEGGWEARVEVQEVVGKD